MKKFTTLFFAFLVIAAATTSGCKKTHEAEAVNAAKEKGGSAVNVAVKKAAGFRAENFLSLTGTLFADQDVAIMANVPGNVAKILADEGDFVKKGEPLAVLDQTEYRIALSQAGHQMEAARLALKQAKIDFERAKNLLESHAVSDNQYEMMKLKMDLAENQVKMAGDGVDIARKKFDDAYIRAPFDCYVANRLVSVGTRIITMPATILFRVIDLNNLTFKMMIPEVELKRVAEGDHVKLRFDSTDVDVDGVVHKVIPSVDPRSLSFMATVKIDNEKLSHTLKPGLFGTAKIYNGKLSDTYIIDGKITAPVEGSKNKAGIFVAENGKAAARVIEVEELDELRFRVVGP
ncbi:MAG: efflux RND transporter periplasmic adaptor subunit, partial [Deltaproteobacteria bacterium]|nr:efflux RND transporter periplasmic adaptor subunit [Deltaproteobacteria bacterium]